jgi:transketolase
MGPIASREALIDSLSINTIRFLAVDAVQKANSGHPGLPMGAAPMAYALWSRHLRHNPRDPAWTNRDRFVLSAGHGSMLLYALLHLTGYKISREDLKNFRQWGSPAAGHPEYGLADGVETTTGPLGQGFANAVGLAMAEAFLAATFNRPGYPIVDHYTYVLASDGDMMEGVTSEAASLAGHLNLGKLIVLYDDNKVMLSAPTLAAFSEDVCKRFQAYGWQTFSVEDGNNIEEISRAIGLARTAPSHPTLIRVRTVIGYGSPNRAGTCKAHGEPLGVNEVKLTKEALGWPSDKEFMIPDRILENFRIAIKQGKQMQDDWENQFANYAEVYPEMAEKWEAAMSGKLPEGWDANLPSYPAGSPAMATRDANGATLNTIARHIPTFIGGDADLSSSTKTVIKDGGDFSTGNYAGRNMEFGIREHAMGAITNGIALHGGIIKPYTATFMVFADYMRPPIRLASLMGIKPLFIFTHDSIGVGEDGPTHQPVEQLASLRCIPGLVVFRPADANEAVAAWKTAMELDGPAALVFTRQKLPVLALDGVMEGVAHGAYIKAEAKGGRPDVLLLATGSEVQLAMKAHEQLAKEGIKARVVSMTSWELFAKQDEAYRDRILPPEVTARVAVEAGVSQGWHQWVGPQGKIIALDRFGASAPAEILFQKFGFTAEAVIDAAKSLLKR